LENGGQPASCCGGCDNSWEVFGKPVHDQGLAQNTLLVSILESTEARSQS
jgi:hypothetical protein